jgi:hypothetical protein
LETPENPESYDKETARTAEELLAADNAMDAAAMLLDLLESAMIATAP